MKIAVAGDIHLHEFSEFSRIQNVTWNEEKLLFIEDDEKGTPVNSRLLDILTALVDIRNLCEEQKIPYLLIAGDLFHKRGSISTIVYNMTYRVLESFKTKGVEVVIIAGNHDQIDNSDVPENSLFGLKDICTIISSPQYLNLEQNNEVVGLLGVPFSKNKKLVLQHIHEFTPSEEIPTILIAHLGINGAFVGKSNYANQDEYSTLDLQYNKFKYVVLGHYHKPQLLEYNTFYTGAPIQHNFNDEGDERGFWILDTNKRYDMEFVPLASPKFITISDTSAKMELLEGNFVRIKADETQIDDILDSLSSTEINTETVRIELEKSYEVESRCNIGITMSFEEIIQNYSEQFNPQAKEIGLKILNEVYTG